LLPSRHLFLPFFLFFLLPRTWKIRPTV
jgi:hypothetical protein